jgi:uracil-DNA glycosylase family 4
MRLKKYTKDLIFENMDKILKLKEIENEVKECKKCPLYKTRKFPVAGEGNPDAKVLLIGLGPGYNENLQGKPFVGAAGKFLDELFELAGLKREEVFITNVMKCYLPNNTANEGEIKTCTSYLERQIQIIKPKVILTLGNVATSFIFNKFGIKVQNIGKIHGERFKVRNLLLQAEIIPMYHPAAALYNAGMKEILKKDWEKISNLNI